jgi:hypothetical protein
MIPATTNLPGLTDSFASHLAASKHWCQVKFVEALIGPCGFQLLVNQHVSLW